MTIRTNRLSKEHQRVCSITMKHGGEGTAVNVISDITGHTISGCQANYTREILDDNLQCTTKSKSNAEQLIQYLRHRSKVKKDLRFKALYHCVTTSSLLAMDVTKQQRACVAACFQEK